MCCLLSFFRGFSCQQPWLVPVISIHTLQFPKDNWGCYFHTGVEHTYRGIIWRWWTGSEGVQGKWGIIFTISLALSTEAFCHGWGFWFWLQCLLVPLLLDHIWFDSLSLSDFFFNQAVLLVVVVSAGPHVFIGFRIYSFQLLQCQYH